MANSLTKYNLLQWEKNYTTSIVALHVYSFKMFFQCICLLISLELPPKEDANQWFVALGVLQPPPQLGCFAS
jgi:hypothetical protein